MRSTSKPIRSRATWRASRMRGRRDDPKVRRSDAFGVSIRDNRRSGTAVTGRPLVESNHMPLSSIEEAIQDIRAGKMVIVMDDEDRENEGDLTMAADLITPDAVNFMTKYGRGL